MNQWDVHSIIYQSYKNHVKNFSVQFKFQIDFENY